MIRFLPGDHKFHDFQSDERRSLVRGLAATVRNNLKSTRTETEDVGDEALLALIRADPRYLLSPLVGVRALWWKLLVIKGDVRTPGRESRKEACQAILKLIPKRS